MSKRQPTIEIDDRIVALDEIVGIIEWKSSAAEKGTQTFVSNAVKLINGTILPLPPPKIRRVMEFLYRNEQ